MKSPFTRPDANRSDSPPDTPDIFASLIVPVRNAAGHLRRTIGELDTTMRSVFRHYEIVVVDDASSDNTVAVVQQLQDSVGNIQLYCLNRRSGIDVAMIAGLDNAIGDFLLTINVERDPADMIPLLWSKAQEGYEVVCGVRPDRATRGHRLFYRAFAATAGLDIPAGISDVRLYSRRIAGFISQNNDRHLLLKVIPYFASCSVAAVEYTPVHRAGGFGERGLSAGMLTAVTILLASSIRPLRLVTLMSLGASMLSLFYAVYVVAIALFKTHVVEGWTSIALPMAIMFFLLSTVLGILSEYIYMLSQQSTNRPVYSIVRESTSSAPEIRRKLNVVEEGGAFAEIAEPQPGGAYSPSALSR